MSALYYFQDFDRFQHSELFLRDHIQEVVDLFIPDKRYTLMTRVRTIRARKLFREPLFLCEIQLDAPQNSTPIIIKKTNSDFYQAALQVAHALKKVLRRQSSHRAQHHRKEHRDEQRNEMMIKEAE